MSFAKKKILAAVAASVLGFATVPAVAASSSVGSRLAESQFKTIMQFSQSYTAEGKYNFTERRGPMTKSEAGFGLSKNVVEESVFLFTGLPRALGRDAEPAVTLTQEEAIRRGNIWMELYATQVAATMGEHLTKRGSSAGILTYSEEVYISRTDAEPIKKMLSFVMTVNKDGKATFGSPLLTSADPEVMHVTYTPLKPGDGLEENWSFPNAGTLEYKVLDSKGAAKTASTTIYVNGVYDGQEGDQSMVRCLMDHSKAGCTAGYPDVKTLMHQRGADMAIVDYVNQLVPVYDEVPGAGGEPDYVPRVALTYTDRTWSCKVYGNKGEYGYVLDVAADRYYAQLDESNEVSYIMSESHKGRMLSPQKEFFKEVAANTLPGNPNYYVISPVPGDSTLYSLTDEVLRDVLYVAPIRLTATVDFLEQASVTGSFPLTKEGGSGGSAEYIYGTPGNDYLSQGSYSGSIVFNLDSPEDIEEFALVSEVFDDWMLMTVNGTAVFGGPEEGITRLRYNEGKTFDETRTTDDSGRITNDLCIETPRGDPRGKWACGPGSLSGNWGGSAPPGEVVCGPTSSTDSGYYQDCVKVNADSFFQSCQKEYTDGGGDGSYYDKTYCSKTSCAYTGDKFINYNGNLGWLPKNVEYTLASGAVGCGVLERGDSSRYTVRNLLPYLKPGRNEIKVLLLVGKKGEMAARLRVKGCGANMGFIDGDAPPVPPSGDSQSLRDKLLGMRDQ